MKKSLVLSFLSLALLSPIAHAAPSFDCVMAAVLEQKEGTAAFHAAAVFPDDNGLPAGAAIPSIPLLTKDSELSLKQVTDIVEALHKVNGGYASQPFTDQTYIGYTGRDIALHLLFYFKTKTFLVMGNRKESENSRGKLPEHTIQLPQHADLHIAVQTHGNKHSSNINGITRDYSFGTNNHGLPFIEENGPQSIVRLMYNGQASEHEIRMWVLLQEIYRPASHNN